MRRLTLLIQVVYEDLNILVIAQGDQYELFSTGNES